VTWHENCTTMLLSHPSRLHVTWGRLVIAHKLIMYLLISSRVASSSLDWLDMGCPRCRCCLSNQSGCLVFVASRLADELSGTLDKYKCKQQSSALMPIEKNNISELNTTWLVEMADSWRLIEMNCGLIGILWNIMRIGVN